MRKVRTLKERHASLGEIFDVKQRDVQVVWLCLQFGKELTPCNMFEIKKGTKQGSSLLFNMVLQKALEDDIPRWQKKKGLDIYLSDKDHDCLTNLRFAGDVPLFQRTASKNQLRMHHPNETFGKHAAAMQSRTS